MSTLQVNTNWTRGAIPHSLLTAKRTNETVAAWAEDHVSDVLDGGGASTAPASGSNGPYTHTVTWSKDGTTFTSELTNYESEAALAEAVQAFKDAIVANGGTVVSG